MANVIVMTDTVACVPAELAQQHGMALIPAANIVVDGRTYIEGKTISATECYKLIVQDPDSFLTSPMTPGYILDEYRRLSTKSEGLLFITISGALSAVSKTANLAADSFRDESPETNVRVLDSKAFGGTQGLVALAAATEASKGRSLEQVVSAAEQVRQETGGFFMLDTLRYIYRTGRMSKEEAEKAASLNVKPINRITPEGTVEFVDSVTEREDGFTKLVDLIRKEAGTDTLHFMINHAAAPEMAERFTQLLRQAFNCLSLTTSDYSPVMGYGAGPGALLVGFHPQLDLSK